MALLWMLGSFETFRQVRWFAGLAGAAAFFSITNLAFSVPGASPNLVHLAASLGGFAAAAAAVFWLLYVRVRRGLTVLDGVDSWIAGFSALVALLPFIPGLVYRNTLITVPVPWLGLSYRIPESTPLALVVYATLFLPLLASARHLRDAGSRAGRWLHTTALVAIIAAGVNEALISAGLINSPYLLELTYALMMLAVGYEAFETFARRSRQLVELTDTLQEQVDQRTAELLAAQQQALRHQQLAGLGRLAAGVAHEINNPLTYVQSNLDFLGEKFEEEEAGEVGEAVVEAINDAKDGVARVVRIVRDLRVMTPNVRAAAAGPLGASRWRERPLALNDAVVRALKLSAHVVQGCGAVVEVDLADELWVACGDEPLVRALSNLLCNAAQATQAGRPNTLTVVAEARDERWIELRVGDTGRGIAAEQLPHIFEPFFSGRPGEGMGLGLSITHALLRSLGGEVHVESKVGVGTTFRLELPRAERDEAVRPEVEETMKSKKRPELSQGRRIVVIDDEPLVARSLKRLLVDDEVEIYTDPEQGLKRLLDRKRSTVDAVLCDRHMGPCSGAKLQARVRATDAELAGRFIFISGDTFDERDTLEDATPFVAKPVELARLHAALESLPSIPADEAVVVPLKRALG